MLAFIFSDIFTYIHVTSMEFIVYYYCYTIVIIQCCNSIFDCIFLKK